MVLRQPDGVYAQLLRCIYLIEGLLERIRLSDAPSRVELGKHAKVHKTLL